MLEPSRIVYVLRHAKGTAPLAAAALVVAMMIGTWWTAQAVVSGEVAAMVTRLTLSVMVGTFYFVVFRICYR